ncbi:MAG: DUF3536 domain-containing protein [Thermoplasmata archaeon]
MSERYVCVHGHFYQPPRENPWLEFVEVEDSAAPYHDWNDRITAECYGPNARARILDPAGSVRRILSTYSRISFDFGPTLLEWMESARPEVYDAILSADRESQRRYRGHGSAIAQAYNHSILPLASPRDRRTQIRWGVADFVDRFARPPEGIWLPETAVDLGVLEAVAEAGLSFTILAPTQARRVRPIGGGDWQSVEGGRVDPSCAYAVRLPSGRSVAVFFYDGPISHAIAFERLLDSGGAFADRLRGAFVPDPSARPWSQLVHVAVDGETFGHHHRHGEMALADAIHRIETAGNPRWTNYGAYLADNPPAYEVEIVERTSWSCAHGVERWRSNCGCSTGQHPEWNQAWRGPLREAFDALRDRLDPLYEEAARPLVTDPWAARDDYIVLTRHRDRASRDAFLARHATHPLDPVERVRLFQLLEMERHVQRMYTSCGWFFDEVTGIEGRQVLLYAARAAEIATALFGIPAGEDLLRDLERVPSNVAAFGNAAAFFRAQIAPAAVDLRQIVARHAVLSLFQGRPATGSDRTFEIVPRDQTIRAIGTGRLSFGVASITSRITEESSEVTYGAIHLGGLNLVAGARTFRGPEDYQALVTAAERSFAFGDLPGILQVMTQQFDSLPYSLRTLSPDDQRWVVDCLLHDTLFEAEHTLRGIHERSSALIAYLIERRIPVPEVFRSAAGYTLNADLRHEFEREVPDLGRIRALLEEADRWRIPITGSALAFAPRRAVERAVRHWIESPWDVERLTVAQTMADLVRALPYDVDLERAQSDAFPVLARHREELAHRGEADPNASAWTRASDGLARALRLSLP